VFPEVSWEVVSPPSGVDPLHPSQYLPEVMQLSVSVILGLIRRDLHQFVRIFTMTTFFLSAFFNSLSFWFFSSFWSFFALFGGGCWGISNTCTLARDREVGNMQAIS